jgi:hypothetical protein
MPEIHYQIMLDPAPRCIEPRALMRDYQQDKPLSILNDFDRWFRVRLLVAEHNVYLRKLEKLMQHPNCRCEL